MGMPKIPQPSAPPPVPQATDPLVLFARQRERELAARRTGRASTILASGATTPAAGSTLGSALKLGGGY